MRNLFFVVLCLVLSLSATSQQRTTSPIEGEYMEVRFVPAKGLSFRLAPDLPFQKTGLFNKNLKPYFKQYDESLRYQKQYNRSFLGIAGGAALCGVGSVVALDGAFFNSPNDVRLGSAVFVSGFGLMLWSNHINATRIYKAVDAFNLNKNPNIKDIEYLEAIPHPTTLWQFRTSPSEDYQSVGLYGRKLKPYLEKDEAAYNAYKKYRTGHMIYSLGNIGGLVGTGILFSSLFANNNSFRNGLITSTAGIIAVFIGSNSMNKNIYQAMDLMNYQKNPIINSSLIPSLQPSSHSAGLGLVWSIQ